MRFTRVVVLVIAFLVLSGCWLESQQLPTPVSLIQLMSTPEKFDGKVISVIGFAELSNESSLLYVYFEDYRQGILENGVWLDRNETLIKQKDQLNLKYIRVAGLFRAKLDKAGFLHIGITDITSCNVWSDPDHPRLDRYRSIRDKNGPGK